MPVNVEKSRMFSNLTVKFICHVALKLSSLLKTPTTTKAQSRKGKYERWKTLELEHEVEKRRRKITTFYTKDKSADGKAQALNENSPSAKSKKKLRSRKLTYFQTNEIN